MLTQIKLTNFKCFKEETTFPLSKLNLFTGVNGAGKSTLLQALLLMQQSIKHNAYTHQLILNDDPDWVSLGGFSDVKNQEISITEPIYFEFSIENEHSKNTIRYCYCIFKKLKCSHVLLSNQISYQNIASII